MAARLMPQPSDGSFWAVLVGAGGLGGVFITKGFGYLTARLRTSTTDRRQSSTGSERLIRRLELRLDVTERRADAADARGARFELEANECRANLDAANGRIDDLEGTLETTRASVETMKEAVDVLTRAKERETRDG